MLLALPAAAAPLHVFFLAGEGGGGSPEFPFVGWGGQESKEEEKPEGGGGQEPASGEARHWPSSQGLSLKKDLPAPHPSLPCPPGSLAAEPASWAHAKPNDCQEERKKHFRAERPLWALLQPRIPLSHRQV